MLAESFRRSWRGKTHSALTSFRRAMCPALPKPRQAALGLPGTRRRQRSMASASAALGEAGEESQLPKELFIRLPEECQVGARLHGLGLGRRTAPRSMLLLLAEVNCMKAEYVGGATSVAPSIELWA